MKLDSTPCFDLRSPLPGCGAARHEKRLVVGDSAMFTLAGLDQPICEGVAGALAESRVIILVIDLIGPFTEELIQVSQCPHRMLFWVHLAGERAWSLGRLGIAEQVVNELRVGRSKEPLNDGPKPGLSTGTYFLDTAVARYQGVEILAVKLFAAIDHEGVRKAPKAFHANAQCHHARTIAGRIKGQIDGEHTTRKSIHQEGDPRLAQRLAGHRRTDLDVQLGVIEMDHSKRTLPVPRRVAVQLLNPGFLLVRRFRSRALLRLFVASALFEPTIESPRAQGNNVLCFTRLPVG